MDRSETNRMTGPKLGLIMGTALASVTLAGCTTAAPADVSFNKAQTALEKGQTTKAVSHAESAVLADGRNAEYRAVLGAAYLESGRFEAAAQSFADAMELGDSDPRTVLSYALAKTASGDNASAIDALENNARAIDPADLGLAMALAGKPERGVHVLTNALRGGQNSAKMRQNLAYAYALNGNWRAARVMAAEDVPADQLDARLSEWASTSKPEDYQVRVAGLLGVDAVADGGLPRQLALSSFDENAGVFAEAAAQVPADTLTKDAQPSETEMLAMQAPAERGTKEVETVDPDRIQQILAATSTDAKKPAAAPKPVAMSSSAPRSTKVAGSPKKPGARFVSNPVVQKVPAAPRAETRRSNSRGAVAANSSQRRMAVASRSTADTHLVQLGSFESRAVAKSKWAELQKRFPQLKNHDLVLTKAVVKGKTYYRVAAAGFGLSGARSMCSTAKAKGIGCFAYAKSNPPAGAVDSGVRIAARSR
ncbi:MAG: SPOR domain-containing protein [Pseudomonadota bacterium]